MDEYERKHGNLQDPRKIADRLTDDSKTQIRTNSEFLTVALQLQKEINKIIQRDSKWNGNISGVKKLKGGKVGDIDWGGNIRIVFNADDTTVLHELLHTYSALHVDEDFFFKKDLIGIEETTVAYFAENYMKDKGKQYHKSYPERTKILYNINNRLNLYDTDFEFAKALISVPVEERYDWLHDKVMQAMTDKGASINDLDEVSKYLKNINEEFE